MQQLPELWGRLRPDVCRYLELRRFVWSAAVAGEARLICAAGTLRCLPAGSTRLVFCYQSCFLLPMSLTASLQALDCQLTSTVRSPCDKVSFNCHSECCVPMQILPVGTTGTYSIQVIQGRPCAATYIGSTACNGATPQMQTLQQGATGYQQWTITQVLRRSALFAPHQALPG